MLANLPNSYKLIQDHFVNFQTFYQSRLNGTHCGSRCLGHGTKWNNCGTEKMKLKTWGIKNNSIVLLKCPSIATTANVIPEK